MEEKITNREDILLELAIQRGKLIEWLSIASINENNLNGNITKANIISDELVQIDKLIEQLIK